MAIPFFNFRYRFSTMTHHHASAYVRRTVPLKGTVTRHVARLDLPSVLAVRYGRAWFRAASASGAATVHESAVVRRALKVYMDHLAGPCLDPEREADELVRCSRSTAPTEDAKAETLARLEEAEGASTLPPFHRILTHPGAAAMVAQVDQRADELVRQMSTERRRRTTPDEVTAGAPAVR